MFSATPSVEAAARAAITAAAEDIESVITTTLNSVSSDVYRGTVGSSYAEINWDYLRTDPDTNHEYTQYSATIGFDTISIEIGTRSFLDPTLGQGGPAGNSFELVGSSIPSNWIAAVGSASLQAKNAQRRGGGPRLGTFSGSSTIDENGPNEVTAYYSIDYGISYGSVAFDFDSNDNGFRNTDAQLAAYWHYNHTADVPGGKRDLYSVALHEMLHVLGIGASASWDELKSGANWLGSEAIAVAGSGTGLVESGHIAEGIMSISLLDGMPQEAAMDPDILPGTRKGLTTLDLAFLRDIGWQTITPTIPNPPDYNGDGDVDGEDLAAWERWFGVNGNADANGDGDTDGRDYLVWLRNYTGPNPLSASQSVPEPTTAALLWAVAGTLISSRRRHAASSARPRQALAIQLRTRLRLGGLPSRRIRAPFLVSESARIC
jgi:hypothetical protein